MQKMMRRFDASDEHINELRGELASIGQKVDTHAISIKQIELQVAQLSTTVNTRQLGTLPTNTVKNQKNEDQGAFTIPCTVKSLHFAKALCDLGESKNLMPLSIYKKLGLGDPTPTAMRLLMADRTVKRPIGILHDVLVKVESFIFSADFVIFDCEVNFEVPIILGRSFLATGRALVNMEKGQMKFRLNNEEVTFNIFRSMRQSGELQSVSAISYIEKMKKHHYIKIEK